VPCQILAGLETLAHFADINPMPCVKSDLTVTGRAGPLYHPCLIALESKNRYIQPNTFPRVIMKPVTPLRGFT